MELSSAAGGVLQNRNPHRQDMAASKYPHRAPANDFMYLISMMSVCIIGSPRCDYHLLKLLPH